MGELILCNQTIASLPYYLDSVSLNVYSLEEISYYIEHNMYLIDAGFMNDEFCMWVEKELGQKELGKKLTEMAHSEGTLSEFVTLLLRECGYCNEKTILEISQVIQEMQQKSPFEFGKMRADRMMENKKYINAVFEYRRLLQMEKECKENGILAGNIYHNLGCAYAKLYLFEEAAKCFKSAFERNQSHESLVSCMAAWRCGGNKMQMEAVAEEFGVNPEETASLATYWTAQSRSPKITEMEERLNRIFSESGMGIDNQDEIIGYITNWKEEYIKNCKM